MKIYLIIYMYVYSKNVQILFYSNFVLSNCQGKYQSVTQSSLSFGAKKIRLLKIIRI